MAQCTEDVLALQEDAYSKRPWPAISNQQSSALAADRQHQTANITAGGSDYCSGFGITLASCDLNQLKDRVQVL